MDRQRQNLLARARGKVERGGGRRRILTGSRKFALERRLLALAARLRSRTQFVRVCTSPQHALHLYVAAPARNRGFPGCASRDALIYEGGFDATWIRLKSSRTRPWTTLCAERVSSRPTAHQATSRNATPSSFCRSSSAAFASARADYVASCRAVLPLGNASRRLRVRAVQRRSWWCDAI